MNTVNVPVLFFFFFAYYVIAKYAYLDATSESQNHLLN